ncbi:MAG: DUF4423 domain-containing protein [Blastocatellia bacterium]
MKTTIAALAPQLSRDLSFRLCLQAELARRCLANPQYSLRSFALHLGIDHSTLSQLLRGKRALTEKTIAKLGGRLGLASEEIAAFVAQERLIAAGDSAASLEIRQLTMDTVSVLSDPTHRSILELMRLDEFTPDSRWIARVLNLTVDEVNVAVTRLAHLGLLEMADHNRWVNKSGETASSNSDFSHMAIERLAERVRRLSASVVHDAPVEAVSTRIVINSDQMRIVKELIETLQQAAPTEASETACELEIYFHPIRRI